jgi:diguanylate cyclase (GGDEF)-like protein
MWLNTHTLKGENMLNSTSTARAGSIPANMCNFTVIVRTELADQACGCYDVAKPKSGRLPGIKENDCACQPEMVSRHNGFFPVKRKNNQAELLDATRTLLATLAHSAPEATILLDSIEALMQLIHVRSGALSVLDMHGKLALFVYAGMSEEEARQIMHRPRGGDLLGKVIRENIVLRLDNMSDDRGSEGYPAQSTQMPSLLTVPICKLDHMYGRIYLCDKLDNTAFSDEDEELAVNFANALSLILDNKQKMAELRLEQSLLMHSAFHDPLTNLPNRVLLGDRIGQALCHANRNQSQVAILFCDLDGFKAINDSMGHQAGDLVLKTMGERFKSCIREYDTVARIGGDEFVFVLSKIESAEYTEIVAQKILDVISQSIHIEGSEIMLSGSIGIAIFPFDGDETERLIRKADAAMYRTKACGKNNYRFFREEMAAVRYG